MAGDREAVCFIADLLHQVQCLRVCFQYKRLPAPQQEQLLQARSPVGPLGDANQQYTADAQTGHDLRGGRQLTLTAVDQQDVGQPALAGHDPSIPPLDADANRLTQVFLNLARNAIQALRGAGGKLTIKTRMALDHRIASRSGRPGPFVTVLFQDDGPGMSEEVLQQATTPFFTTRTDGTGLGLAVSESWIARHGGTLRIESEPGAGTQVEVLLPLRGPE